MTKSTIFLKRGVHIVHVVSAMLVPPAELPSEEETVKGVEAPQEQLSVQEQQEKMMDKLNLDGLSEWSPIMLLPWRSYSFPIMTSLYLGPMSWDVPVPLSMRFASTMMNPSKNI